MFYSRLILYFYAFLTLLALICPVKISFLQFLPGLILMWSFYLVFSLGSKLKVKKFSGKFNLTEKTDGLNKIAIAIAFLHLLFYPIYIKFYTGSSVTNIISALSNGLSTYAMYQENFKNSNISQLSLSKLPLIFGHGILKFFFILTVFRVMVFHKKILKHEMLCMFIMVLVTIFVGLSRGTSFELFEIAIVFLFAYACRRIFAGYSRIFSIKALLKISLFFIVVSSYFAYNINVRMGDGFSFFDSNDFDKTALVYQFSKPLSLVLYSFYGYFLFGLYFNSTVLTKLWMASMTGFLSFLIPGGFSFFNIDVDLRTYINRFIDVGAMWEPDSSVYIIKFGILITLIIVFLLGFSAKYLYYRTFNNLSALILLYYVFYFFISMPVGNFISTSSASQISIMVALITFKQNYFAKWFITKQANENSGRLS